MFGLNLNKPSQRGGGGILTNKICSGTGHKVQRGVGWKNRTSEDTFFVAHPSQLSIIKCSLPLNPYTKISGPSPHSLPKPGSFYYTNTSSTIHLAFYDIRVSKCGPMQKDQGVGTVVNNLLQINLGYHMVFKVVTLKIKKGESKLLSPSIKYIKKYFLSFFLSLALSVCVAIIGNLLILSFKQKQTQSTIQAMNSQRF